MKENLTGSLKSRESKRKRNNRKIGRKRKRLESTFFIKSTMIEKERSDNTKRPRSKSFERNNKTSLRSKRESNNMKPSNKLVAKLITNAQRKSKISCCRKSPKRRKEDV